MGFGRNPFSYVAEAFLNPSQLMPHLKGAAAEGRVGVNACRELIFNAPRKRRRPTGLVGIAPTHEPTVSGHISGSQKKILRQEED